VPDVDLTSVGLQIKITVSIVVIEVLHVSFSYDQRLAVVCGIGVRKVFCPLGNDISRVSCKWLGSVSHMWEFQRREKSVNFGSQHEACKYK